MRTQPIDQGVCNSAASNFVFVSLCLAVKHTIQKSVSLLNKGWSYQANAPRLDSRLHCQSFDTSHCRDPNRNFTHLEHCKGGINIRFAGTEAPPARCGCGADVSRISSISALKKIYEGLIANRLTHYIQTTNCMHKNQFRFLPGRDLTESIFFLTQTILSNITLNHKSSYVAFIDFKTAFPNTCRPALWEAVHDLGIQGKLWRNLQSLYTHTKGRVLHPLIKETDTYDINIGLLEGSRLSPILYAFFANSLLTRLQSKFPNIKIQSPGRQSRKFASMDSCHYVR
jgi:hypothetical protein